MFFVIDVETSGLTPWTGELLTVACVPVSEDGFIYEAVFYERVAITRLTPLMLTELERSETDKFWHSVFENDAEKGHDSYREAWTNNPRLPLEEVAIKLEHFVREITFDKPAFVAANPSFFDKMWIEYMYATTGTINPFHYRTLCLRSMRFGLEEETAFGSRKGAQESEQPHHALYDALSEAEDLQYLINVKKHRLEQFNAQ